MLGRIVEIFFSEFGSWSDCYCNDMDQLNGQSLELLE